MSASNYGHGGMPFAVDDDLQRRAVAGFAPLQRQLMCLSQEKDRLDAEYARLPPGGGRNAAARRHKAAVEGRLEELNVQMSSLRTRLRAQPLGPM